MKRLLHAVLFAILAIGSLAAAMPASAQSDQRCFAETGFCISGPIRTYWERNGGLAVFGFPISDLRVEYIEGWQGPIQWFERDRLEDHTQQGQGVLAGRLGAQVLEAQGRPWQGFPRATGDLSGCRYFPETGHSLCGAFRTYWERNGGLERFGFPITEQFEELLLDPTAGLRRPYPVQYFERRRMEVHVEYGGAVLLGLLGRQTFEYAGCEQADPPLSRTAVAYHAQIGCPTWSFPFRAEGVRAAQAFERGTLVWVKGGFKVPNMIYMVFYDNNRGSLAWRGYNDSWFEGQPASGGETPPQGLFEPVRGFGKLWRENAEVRNTLGWAVAPERQEFGPQQSFSSGAQMLYYNGGAGRLFLLYPDGRAEDLAVQY